jgi:hypothetical protein
MNNKRNFWPAGIIASIIFIIFACAYTIKIALDNPVQMDSAFNSNYHIVDENINEIMRAQAAFDDKYKVTTNQSRFAFGKNSLVLQVEELSTNSSIDNASMELLITRPETTEHDQMLKPTNVKDGKYTFDGIDIALKGRWQIVAKVTIGKDYGYYKNELLAVQ